MGAVESETLTGKVPDWIGRKRTEFRKKIGPKAIVPTGIWEETIHIDVDKEPTIGKFNSMEFFTVDQRVIKLPPGAAEKVLGYLAKGISTLRLKVSPAGTSKDYEVSPIQANTPRD